VGTITGGSADNVVPAHCTVTGEVRSFDDGSARRQLEIIKAEFLRAGEKFGAKVDFTTETLCLAYKTDTDDLVVRRFQSVCRELGLKGELTVTYGGSDNNHYANRGFHGLVAASGMNNCHSCKESTTVNELVNSARLAEGLILSKE
jgi:tripeptide aminopeptidase